MKYSVPKNPQSFSGKFFITLMLTLTVLLSMSFNAGAATRTWLPTNGGLWTTATNWSGGVVPANGDDIIINSNQSSNITAVPTISLNSLTVTGNCLWAAATTGNTITVTNTFYVASGITFTTGSSSARLNFTLSGIGTIAGNFAFDAGTGTRIFTVSGTLIVLPTGRVYDPILSNGSQFSLSSGATLKIGQPGGIIAGSQTVQNTNVAICFGGSCAYNAAANYEYIGTSAQVTGAALPATVGSLTINNTAGVTLPAAKTITNTLAINNGAVLNLGTFSSTAGRLSFNGTNQVSGSWGYTGSGATNINTTYFANNTGKVTIGNSVSLTCWLNLSSAVNTDNQAYCVGQAITPITYATTTATGATVTGLPTGVTGSWSSNVFTISGTPTVSGFYTYKVTLTGGTPCTTTKTGTLNSDVSLRYTSPNVYLPSTLITPLNPTYNGTATVSNYSISPALTPTGLNFSTSTGIISGTTSATPVGSATYTVTANLSCGGSISFGVVIAVGNYRYAVASGNWNSTSTWAASSGGTAGVSVPTSGDDVFIGEGATSYTVTVPTGISAVCNNLNMGLDGAAGVITFATSSSNLTVYGDLSMNVPNAAVTSAINVNAGTLNVNGSAELSNDPSTRESTTATFINQINITTGTVNISGNLTFSALAAAQSQIIFTNAGTLNLAGNFIIPASLGTLTPGTTSTVNFNGTSVAQTIPIGLSAITYSNLTINNTHASGAIISAAISATNVTGNLSVASGTLNNGGFAIVGNGAKTFSVSAGASFLVSGTTSAFPSGFGTNTLGSTSTVNYKGSGDQTIFDVASPGYGHLILATGGTKTIATDGLDVQGNITISAGTTLAASSFTSNIKGNWINNGTFTANSSTINFNGTSTISGSSANSFNNLAIAASSFLTGPASGTINVAGNYSNSGSFTHNSGTVIFNGTGAQTINSGGSSFNNFSITNTGGTCTASTNTITVVGTFTTAASTILDMGANALSVATVAHSGTLNTQNTTGTPITTGKTWGGTVNYNAIAGQTVMAGTYSNLTISGTGTNSKIASGNIAVNGVLNLASANASATQGALSMDTYTLTMGVSANTTGTGDVNGIVTRTNFTLGSFYSFGNQFTTIGFTSGTIPTSLSVKIVLGTTTTFYTTAVKRYYDIIRTGGDATTFVNLRLHYLDSELNGNTEANMDLWDDDNGAGGEDHGHTLENGTDNWVEIGMMPLTYLAGEGTWNVKYWVIKDEVFATKIWYGGTSTVWGEPLNWINGVPVSTENVVIPVVGGGFFYPTLPASTTINSISIDAGATVYGGTGTTLTLSHAALSSGSTWENLGTFNPGTSTINFTGANCTISGTTNFNNIAIQTGASVANLAGSITRIAGAVTVVGTGAWDADDFENTVEYNGANQTIVNPNAIGGTTNGYHNLILSGTGTTTWSGEYYIHGDYTNNSAATNSGTWAIELNGPATGSGAMPQYINGTQSTSFQSLEINNSAGVTISINATVTGSLIFTSGILTTGSYAVIVPTTGSISRTSGHVNGNLQMAFDGSHLGRKFEIGNATVYAPATVTVNAATSGSITAFISSGTNENTPGTNASGINQSAKSNLYWTLTNNSMAGYNNYSMDIDISNTTNTGTASSYVQRVFSGTWHTTTHNFSNASNNISTGNTYFGEFEVGVTGAQPIVAVGAMLPDYCLGSTAVLSVSVANNPTPTYQWKKGGTVLTNAAGHIAGATTNTLTITNLQAGDDGNDYNCVVTSINGETTSESMTVNTTTGYTWLGTDNSIWSQASNWTTCGVPPSSGADVTITGAINLPVLPADASFHNLTINALGILDLGGKTLTISGRLTTDGTIKGSATSSLVFANGATGELRMDSNDEASSSLNSISFEGSAYIRLFSALNIYGVLSSTGGSRFDLLDEHLTLKSNAAGTARVADLTNGHLDNASNVTVERYIENPKRSWHMLSAIAVKNSSQTIHDAWQEAGNATSGYGTVITSNLNNGTNGFDATSVSASILTYNSGTIAWDYSLANTNSNKLSDHDAYLLFVRGDRNYYAATPGFSSTVLRSTGTLTQGSQASINVPSTTGSYTLVANPYASPLNMESVLANTSNIRPSFYIVDPSLSGEYGVGGYRLVTRTSANNYTSTPVIVEGSSPDATAQFVPSGGAFFMTATGGTASFSFAENMKSGSVSIVNPTPNFAGDQQVFVSMKVVNADNSSNLIDGIRVMYNDGYSATTDDDMIKMRNFGENISSYRNTKELIIENRPMISAQDTIFLRMTGMGNRNYRFQVGTFDFAQPGITALLQDAFLGTSTPILLDGSVNIVDFSVNATPASSASDRFRIVFAAPAAPLPISFTSIKAYQQGANVAVEWKVAAELNVKNYEVEKSTNGINFVKLGTQLAIGNNSSDVTYNWLDVNPVSGNNFYRIRSTENSGLIKYSAIAKVNIGKLVPSITVYPNPVTGKQVNLQFTAMDKGMYNIRLINTMGQTVYSTQYSHAGGSATQSISINGVVAGAYMMELISPDNSKQSIRLQVLN